MKQLLRLILVLLLAQCAVATSLGQAKKPTKPKPKAKAKVAAPARSAFTRYDSLRGYLSPRRSCYDVFFYHLNLRVNPKDSSIAGYNIIGYRAEASFREIQIDLYKNLSISKITHQGKPLAFRRDSNAVFVSFGTPQAKGTVDSIVVHYGGRPHIAKNAPWDGGFVWTKDKVGKPWVAVACEGAGASLWWPCKDHLSDEPDSVYISIDVPGDLTCVSNGNLHKTSYLRGGFARFDWRVQYPINNYNVTVNIGNYEQMVDTYTATDGQKLQLDYYVMPYNRGKAEKQFKQVKPMLAAYEKYFGKYPFWNDGYALVETPYLGMEHQSAIAYGNDYRPGYAGKDLSNTGIGLLFDYLIIHETGHEYWGNNVSMADHGEMWINESFCTYAEALYVEALHGREASLKYLKGQSALVENTEPMLGPLNVNYNFKTTDIYFKGANMLNTVRSVIANDSLWFGILRGIQQDFRLKQVRTRDLTDYISQKSGQNLNYLFDQYLRHPSPPMLQCVLTQTGRKDLEVRVRWTANVPGFAMPVQVSSEKDHDDKPVYRTITPTTEWQTLLLDGKASDFEVATNLYYILTDIQGKVAEAEK